jgi:dipeptidyl aminopeptidase/acylaminoacyl peptidase
VSAGLDFARALDRHSKIFRYKTYPNEGYYIYRKDNNRQLLIDMVAFFDQFLRDGAATAPTPLKAAATGGAPSN